ncbi:Beta-1,3-N-acetylglucosaminyltransferase lunatic fringe, putative isoform 1 [Hibiscus syriacus]|uniref:Beta-1,3-N-acetylglucosaminyltransferase lunatic fringe, putative isoform 1 n=1 Tax=Hibiscus syriacus TaxID=106335 RepID=A0A6A2YUY4_HIBSY|nr:uncharacterized protein LOC120156350 [Hibiscus syriacus]KAE8683100.1 Beta-1,3-N-acetylglucosaminyltransferase lunatic fringe, putative isoform 1 [Hibiscus syriacus]
MSPRIEFLKTTAFFISPENPRDMSALVSRAALLLYLFTSITLVVYISFSNRPHSFVRFTYPNVETGPDSGSPPDDDSPTNISHILFGIGGSARTWEERRALSSLWWDVESVRGYVWLDEKPPPGDGGDSLPYRVSSPEWKRFMYSSSRPAVRIARIILDSFNLKLPNVRWFVMGDDDTVFFTHNIVSALRRYDHREMWYIGGISESVEQNVMHAYDMAFGGGGFAVSYPLAEKLVKVLDGCLNRYYYFYGSDQRIWACITEIGVPLTKEPGFHQFDVRGDAYGLLAAHPMAPLLSFHHVEALAPMFPNKTRTGSLEALIEPYRLDPYRILQQSICYDNKRKWSIAVAWGYTIQIYPKPVAAFDLHTPLQTFKTWRSWSDGPFTFNTRIMPVDPCEQPVIYFLDRVEEVGSTGTRTRYKLDTSGKTCNNTAVYAPVMAIKSIIVTSMKMAPDYWQKAPHRQCCEIKDRGSKKKGSMLIRIRKCRQWETTSI